MGKSLPALRGVELLILGGCLLFGCSRGGVDRVEWPTMGTVAAVQYRGDSTGARPGCEAVRAVFDKVDSLLSAYDPSSELSRLAALGDAEVLAKCDPLVRPCYEAAFRLRDETEGLFNPRWKGPGTMDLGAIAKGFAVDLAVREAKISSDALIDLGGNLKAACGDWRVGVLSCEGVESCATAETLTLKPGEACATSAEYYRGKHIKDGRTGGDIDSKVKSVTVVHPTSAMLADGLSTVMFLMGRARGERFLRERYPEAKVIWINER